MNNQFEKRSDFVVVANRLSVDRVVADDGSETWRTSPGGLVTALEPVMQSRRGSAWVGWPGSPDEELEPFVHDGIQLVPVSLSAQDVTEYYEGFSNATLWPLFHDGVAFPEYHREWWDAYVRVNRRFAEAAAAVAAEGAQVWVQDYQLLLVPRMLRTLRPDLYIGFFLHIPFPPMELFVQLPWRAEILDGLLGSDLVGFQIAGGASNFIHLVSERLGYPTGDDTVTLPDGRVCAARAYPISIPTQRFADLAADPAVQERAREIRAELDDPELLFLGVDRLDYTKGIKHRLRAFGELVTSGQLDPDRAAFLQVATPSRERVEEYKMLRDEIDRIVGRINGSVGRIGRQPVTYLHTHYPREEMVAMYSAADVMVVSPLRDGMNLVAKEYIACRRNGDGALVLSEFTGAADELGKWTYSINPYDINGMKATMLRAATDAPEERQRRMAALREQVFTHDIDRWAESFLADMG